MNSFVRKALTHFGFVVLLLAVTAIYFFPQLQGKVLPQGDTVNYKGMSREIETFKEKTGETTLWTNAMFGGMPTYQINTVAAGNQLERVEAVGLLGLDVPIGRFFVAMVCFYILMVTLGVNPWLGVIGAIAFSFSTNSITLFEAGHNTKLAAISHLPLVAAGMVLAFRKKYLLGGLLFALGLGLDIYSNHIQMTYYFFITVLVYGVAQLVDSIRKGEIVDFAKSAGVLILAGGIAVGSAASNLLVTYEYSRDTMRGKPILQADANTPAGSESAVEGLAWDYAMQWSNNVVDVFSSFIPGVAGGSGREKAGANSAFRKALIQKGLQVPAEFQAPLYWGALPFTSGPTYLGATIFFFFFLGLILVKGPVKWWLGIGTLLTFMMSMGKNMEWFNELLFNYFPLFNKFRTPNSVISVTSFLMPFLGFLALNELLKKDIDTKTKQRAVYIAGGITGGICLFFWLLGPSFFDFSSAADAQYVNQYQIDPNALPADRAALMRSDSFRSFALILLCAGLAWAYSQNYIKQGVLLAGLGLLTIFDLWTVGRRYVDSDSFVNKTNYASNFKPRQVDELIMKDLDPNFRVLDLTVSTFQNSSTSYFLKTIGGYHPAKLQRYQDIIERHISKNNEKVLNMLNTKYFILQGQDGQPQMQINMSALGNAWFVNNLQLVPSANAEIDSLTNFDPANTAIIHQEFNNYINNFKPQRDSASTIQLTSYEPNHLTYQSNAGNEQLAVFSEVWYGPNKGWQAYIDGKPVEHIRANYVLRAMRIPAGQHKIEFIFDPKTYKTGVALSTIFSSIIVLGTLGYVGYTGYQSFKQAQNEPEPKPTQPMPKAPARPVTKPTSRATTKPKKKK